MSHGNTKHGHRPRGRSPSPTYHSWMAMKARCNNPNVVAYDRYKGMLCRRWHSFENFLADMGERPSGKTIERIDNRKGYSLSNCRWATRREQVRNSSTPKITFNDAVQINLRRMKGETVKNLVLRYGTTRANIYHIIDGRSWSDAKTKAVELLNRKGT